VTPKPHRFLIDRFAGYADEAASFLRRRRTTRKPFARVHYAGGRSVAYDADTEQGRELFLAASHLIDVAR
jgi:hypothetical protein